MTCTVLYCNLIPGCNEAVNWVVAKTPLKVTPRDLTFLRILQTDDGLPIVRNYRGIQDLGQRMVFDVIDDDSGKEGT